MLQVVEASFLEVISSDTRYSFRKALAATSPGANGKYRTSSFKCALRGAHWPVVHISVVLRWSTETYESWTHRFEEIRISDDHV